MTASSFQTALITGASSGIGRAFALQLAETHSHLILTGRDEHEIVATMKLAKMQTPGIRIDCIAGDLTSAEFRQKLIQVASQASLHTVILNAGAGTFGPFMTTKLQDDMNAVNLNIGSTVDLSHALIPQLIQQSKKTGIRSRFVFVSSHAGFMRIPNFAVYSSAKAFINHFGLILAQELSHEPIDILVSCPGATQSQFSRRSGLPLRMLSKPMPADRVVRKTLASIGKKNLVIITFFDRLLYAASRWLPNSLFDRMILILQRRLLDRAKGAS